MSLKPAIQYAAVRPERPDEGALISGSPVTSNAVAHYQETMATSTKFFWRRGVGYQLTTGSFSRATGVLYTSFRPYGELLPVEDIVVNPVNDVNRVWLTFDDGQAASCQSHDSSVSA